MAVGGKKLSILALGIGAAVAGACATSVLMTQTHEEDRGPGSSEEGVDNADAVETEETGGGSSSGSLHPTSSSDASGASGSGSPSDTSIIQPQALDSSGDNNSELLSSVNVAERGYGNFKTEIWSCAKGLGSDIENKVLHDRTEYSDFGRLTWLGWGDGTNVDQGFSLNRATEGCAAAVIQPIGRKYDFYFKAEMMVKLGSKYASILWLDWATDNDRATSTMTYRLLVLVNRENNWHILTGLWWNNISSGQYNQHYIKLPGENEAWMGHPNKYLMDRVTKVWSGTWKPDAKGTGHIFKDIVVSPGGKDKSEMLGRDDPFADCGKSDGTGYACGWSRVGYYYDSRPKHPGWWGYTSYQNRQSFLQSIFQNSVAQKGTWTTKSMTNVNGTSQE